MTQVTKRDGTKEELNIDKIHRVLELATEGLDNVFLTDVEVNAKLLFYDGVKTSEIHDNLVKSASDLISLYNPDYQYVAARLLLYKLRKDVWGESQSPRLYEHIRRCVDLDIYDKSILKKYTKSEILKLGKYLDHSRDDKFTYSGLAQFINKYIAKNRKTGQIYETPQFVYMLIAMTLFQKYPKDKRIEYIHKAYDAISLFKINLPSPILSGVRTNTRTFSSCTLINVDDTLDSIFASSHAIARYTASRSGIGVNVGKIRSIGSSIRNDEEISTGLIPFLKVIEASVKSCTQSGVRRGAATVNIQWWHHEIQDVVVLKNNAGTDDNRVRKMDYCVSFDRLFFERLRDKKDITLFSPNEVKDLYEKFGTDEFKEEYEKCERDDSIRKITIPAIELATLYLKERVETNRIYAMFIDNTNSQGSFKEKVEMTNLCCEIIQPTKEIQDINDKDGIIGLCTLSCVNLLETTNDETEGVCDIIVRMLDELLDYQSYPLPAVKNFVDQYRSLGVGITNLFGLLAREKVKHGSQEALELVDEKMERIAYYLTKTSIDLAKEKEPCKSSKLTHYSDGIMPIDRANKNAKALVKRDPSMDWDKLRKRAKRYGIRNGTLLAVCPSEASSVVQNSTNGIEPPRAFLVKKFAKQIVPLYETHKEYYTLAFDCTNKNITDMAATMQKWIDMGMSTNYYYDPNKYEEGIPMSELLNDLIYSWKMGMKTLYYCNTKGEDTEIGCDSGGCSL